MSDSDLPQKKDNRMLAIGLALAAAAMLITAGVSKRWLGNHHLNNIGFGPMGCVNCSPADGDSMSNGAFVEMIREADSIRGEDETSAAFAPMGWATFGTCLLAALGLVGAAGLAISNKRPDLPISPATVALLGIMGAMIAGCVFVATKPGGVGFVAVGWGFWVFGIGSVTGIAGAQMLAKAIRPQDPDLLADAMNPDQF